MNWIILIIAGLFEMSFTFCMGKARDASGVWTGIWWTGFAVSTVMSMLLLSKAVQTIPLGTAYPVWTGIGAVGTVVMGILFFNEPATFARLFFIALLVVSIIGLKSV